MLATLQREVELPRGVTLYLLYLLCFRTISPQLAIVTPHLWLNSLDVYHPTLGFSLFSRG